MADQERAGQRNDRQPVLCTARGTVYLTGRQAEVLRLAACGLSGKQIAHHLWISVRTVEDHFSAMRQRTGAHNRGELIAYAVAAGLVKPGAIVPVTAVCETVLAEARRRPFPVSKLV
jgi:DNA-binding NarL/FixJ family response regulator